MESNRIIITGAGGSIGSELVRQLSANNEVYCIDNNETALFDLLEELRLEGRNVSGKVMDIRDKDALGKLPFYPNFVFHAAALKHVTPCEWNPEEAVKTNVLGLKNVMDWCPSTTIVFISTDKAVNPTSVMGMTKAIGERMVKRAGGIVARFANVMGSRGSVIPIWQKQMDEGKPLTITDERMTRYMMTIPEAVALVIEAADTAQPSETIVLDMGKPINILELAQEILKKSGSQVGTRTIGAREGESLAEELMSEEEKKVAVKKGRLWIIP